MGCIESWELGWFASTPPSLPLFVRSFVRSFFPGSMLPTPIHFSTLFSLPRPVSPFPCFLRLLVPLRLYHRNPLSAARLRVKPPKKGCSSNRATSQNAIRAIPRVSRVMDETRPPLPPFLSPSPALFHLRTRSSTFFSRLRRSSRSDDSQKVRV